MLNRTRNFGVGLRISQSLHIIAVPTLLRAFQMIGKNKRAEIAIFDEWTALFLVPPSNFLSKILARICYLNSKMR
ncbi:uncharacterized protein LOC131320449 isoform X3 [Rhododendron vialii]|uniref:uncharacterized protein LOC131320449 isoform X3 n=1 Tax=Rhododendron vialii TaxID=182163 RepID=UPI00265D86A3|nr:uncharacterized protein LOC131320449 isoform X3 [Rhododendron vialii]